MVKTSPATGAIKKPVISGTSTSPSKMKDAAGTFVKRPETKRRSLDNMQLYKSQQNTYAAQSSDKLLQEVMQTFEDIPSKILQYPQMRRDIKTYLEDRSDKGIRILFELSRRIKKLEAGASKTTSAAAETETPAKGEAANAAATPTQEEKVLTKLGDLEESIFQWIGESHAILKREIQTLNSDNDERGANITESIYEKIEETQVEIDKATEGLVVRAQTQIEDLVATVAREIVVEARSCLAKATSALKPVSDPTPMTYASVAAARPGRRPALHSVAVTSTNSRETADEVLAKVKKAVDARATGLKVNKTRKAKNSTVILGCDTETERAKIMEQIGKCGEGLVVAPMSNKDPLVVLKDVYMEEDDEDMVRALYTQNSDIFMGLPQEEREIRIKYKKKTRNPKTSHVVLQVRPRVWQRMTETGNLYIDLQRVRVEDQSPLIQCTKCLAFGHGRKYCTESASKCSHCGGSHLRESCPDFAKGAEPRCCNCSHSGLRDVGHNAFSAECPTRAKWDYLARSTTEYL